MPDTLFEGGKKIWTHLWGGMNYYFGRVVRKIEIKGSFTCTIV